MIDHSTLFKRGGFPFQILRGGFSTLYFLSKLFIFPGLIRRMTMKRASLGVDYFLGAVADMYVSFFCFFIITTVTNYYSLESSLNFSFYDKTKILSALLER